MMKKTPREPKMFLFVNKLAKRNVITPDQQTSLLKRCNKYTTTDNLIEMLREMAVIETLDPLNEDVEDFIQELGAMDAQSLADFVLDLRNNKKGLKNMTPVPVKSYFPAAYLAVIGGLILFGIILSPQIMSALDQVGGGAGNGGGFKLPFMGFLDSLKSFLMIG